MSLPQNPFTSFPIPSMDISPPSSLSSDARGKRRSVDLEQNVDYISTLPDDVLSMILRKLSTEEAIKTSVLSSGWVGVWKQRPYLHFDMKKTMKDNGQTLVDRSHFIAQEITKVINNHNGHLESCIIQHFSYQSEDGTLETWIQSLTHVKRTKHLSLLNCPEYRWRDSALHLSPNIFSHPALKTLFLCRYDLQSAHAFYNCHNIMVLNLFKICAEVGVFNTVIASCPSLKLLILDITWYSEIGCLKIQNNNLMLLHLACTYIDSVEVSAPLLDFFSVEFYVRRCNLILVAPRLVQLSKNCWAVDEDICHTSYNVSCSDQEKANIGQVLLMKKTTTYFLRFKSLAVSVDLTNPMEVYMLQKVLIAWNKKIRDLKIFIKHNVPKEEGEPSVLGAQEKMWDVKSSFFSDDYGVEVVWLYNFSGSSKEELGLVSFLTQRKATKKLMFKTSSIPTNKKLEIEAAMAKLLKLSKGNKELSIECF